MTDDVMREPSELLRGLDSVDASVLATLTGPRAAKMAEMQAQMLDQGVHMEVDASAFVDIGELLKAEQMARRRSLPQDTDNGGDLVDTSDEQAIADDMLSTWPSSSDSEIEHGFDASGSDSMDFSQLEAAFEDEEAQELERSDAEMSDDSGSDFESFEENQTADDDIVHELRERAIAEGMSPEEAHQMYPDGSAVYDFDDSDESSAEGDRQ